MDAWEARARERARARSRQGGRTAATPSPAAAQVPADGPRTRRSVNRVERSAVGRADGHAVERRRPRRITLLELRAWVDEPVYSRPRRNLGRDFSDGVLVAELIHHFCPRLVELPQYRTCNATAGKIDNWNTLNRNTLKKLGLQLTRAEIIAVTGQKLPALEKIFMLLHEKISERYGREPSDGSPELSSEHVPQQLELDADPDPVWPDPDPNPNPNPLAESEPTQEPKPRNREPEPEPEPTTLSAQASPERAEIRWNELKARRAEDAAKAEHEAERVADEIREANAARAAAEDRARRLEVELAEFVAQSNYERVKSHEDSAAAALAQPEGQAAAATAAAPAIEQDRLSEADDQRRQNERVAENETAALAAAKYAAEYATAEVMKMAAAAKAEAGLEVRASAAIAEAEQAKLLATEESEKLRIGAAAAGRVQEAAKEAVAEANSRAASEAAEVRRLRAEMDTAKQELSEMQRQEAACQRAAMDTTARDRETALAMAARSHESEIASVRAELGMAQRSHKAECEALMREGEATLHRAKRLVALEAEEAAEEARRQVQRKLRTCEADAAAAAAEARHLFDIQLRQAVENAVDTERAAHAVTRQLFAVSTRELSEQRLALDTALRAQAEDIRREAASKEAELQKRLNAMEAQIQAERNDHAAAIADAEVTSVAVAARKQSESQEQLDNVSQQLASCEKRASKAEADAMKWEKETKDTAAKLCEVEGKLRDATVRISQQRDEAEGAAATAAAELHSAIAALQAAETAAEEQRLELAKRHGDELRAARMAAQDAAAAAVESVRKEMSRSCEERMAASEHSHTRTLAAIKSEAAAEVESQRRELLELSARKLHVAESTSAAVLQEAVQARQRAESEAAAAVAAARAEVTAIEGMALEELRNFSKMANGHGSPVPSAPAPSRPWSAQEQRSTELHNRLGVGYGVDDAALRRAFRRGVSGVNSGGSSEPATPQRGDRRLSLTERATARRGAQTEPRLARDGL